MSEHPNGASGLYAVLLPRADEIAALRGLGLADPADAAEDDSCRIQGVYVRVAEVHAGQRLGLELKCDGQARGLMPLCNTAGAFISLVSVPQSRD